MTSEVHREWKEQRARDGLPVTGPEYDIAYRKVSRERSAVSIKAYRRRYDAEHRTETNQRQARYDQAKRDRAKAEADAERRREEQRERKREYAKKYYQENRDRMREANRQAHVRRREADPDAERERKRLATKKWRHANRDRENAKLRDKYALDPSPKREIARRYYDTHADEVRERSRTYHLQNRDQQNATHKRWLAREKRRLELGLPVARLHRTPPADKERNASEAEEFFARTYPPEVIQGLFAQDRARWERDCYRARAANYITLTTASHNPARRHEYEIFTTQRARARQAAIDAEESRIREEHEAEEAARMDEIARTINDRLRLSPVIRDPHHNDPTRPHTSPTSAQTGMGR